jgi:hypothetical protein
MAVPKNIQKRQGFYCPLESESESEDDKVGSNESDNKEIGSYESDEKETVSNDNEEETDNEYYYILGGLLVLKFY